MELLTALNKLPLIAILRGIKPEETAGIVGNGGVICTVPLKVEVEPAGVVVEPEMLLVTLEELGFCALPEEPLPPELLLLPELLLPEPLPGLFAPPLPEPGLFELVPPELELPAPLVPPDSVDVPPVVEPVVEPVVPPEPEPAALPPVLADNDALLQIIINLLKNAAEALSDVKKPRILISTAYRHGLAVDAGPGQPRRGLPIELCVIDNGPGAPADIADHLFSPFVSSKPEGQVLGLALVYKLFRDMGGVVQYSREGAPEMTVFRILLARAR